MKNIDIKFSAQRRVSGIPFIVNAQRQNICKLNWLRSPMYEGGKPEF